MSVKKWTEVESLPTSTNNGVPQQTNLHFILNKISRRCDKASTAKINIPKFKGPQIWENSIEI
jgi:hypothetical protein